MLLDQPPRPGDSHRQQCSVTHFGAPGTMASWHHGHTWRTWLANPWSLEVPTVTGKHWKTPKKIGLKRPLYVGFTQCFFKTSPWTKTAWGSVCHGMPIGIQHPPFDRWGDQFYRLCPCQWLGRTKRMCTNLSQIITANLTEFFLDQKKKHMNDSLLIKI